MQPFQFRTGPDVSSVLSAHGGKSDSRFLAGGTTLVDLMRLEVEKPMTLVDVTRLDLKSIRDDEKFFEIGALVSNSDLAHHPAIKKALPLLSEALLSGASPQLRNLATTGGNILQRTRCSYFRDPVVPCNKRSPGSGCSAIDGYDRGLAVLGGSDHCIASHPSDFCVALTALEAIIVTEREGGGREIPIGDFYVLPGETPQIENVLQAGELITAVRIPKRPWYRNSTYVKIRDRSSYAFALTSVALALDLDGRTVRHVRVAFGGIGAKPWRSPEAEEALVGQKLTMGRAAQAGRAALAAAKPGKHNAFKIGLAQQTLLRALHQVGDLS